MDAVNSNFSDASSDCSSIVSNLSEISATASYRFLRYEILAGERINSKLLYTNDEKQFYRFNSAVKNGDAYLCAEPNCKKRVHLRKDKLCIQYEKYYIHNHATKEQMYEELKVLNIIKKKCADLTTLLNERRQSVRDVFYAVLAEYPHLKNTLGNNFFKHERALQLIRNKAIPENPKTADEIAKIFTRDDIMNLLGNTKDGSILYDGAMECDDFSFCVFSSKSSIELFVSHVRPLDRIIMMDGTFAVVPIGSFNQLLILYAVYMEKVRNIYISLTMFMFMLNRITNFDSI